MGEDQAADPVAAGGLGHSQHMEVAADPADEPDRPLPAGGLGEHQPSPVRPAGNSKNSGAHTTVPSGASIR